MARKSVIDEFLEKEIGGMNPKSVSMIETAKNILNAFDKKRLWFREDLGEEIGLDLSPELKEKEPRKWENNRRRFYNALSPLLQVVIESVRIEKKVAYRINRGKLSTYHTNIEKAFSYRYGKWDKEELSGQESEE